MIEVFTKKMSDTWFALALNEQQIISSSFSDTQQSSIRYILGSLPFDQAFEILVNPTVLADEMFVALKEIFDGKEVKTKFALSQTSLSDYTRKVLKATASIPVGYVTSYGEIAKAVGGGPRAVGNIMASNPFAPIVPCHRVVKSDLTLGGYGGGLKTKLELLEREKRGFSDSKQVEGGLIVYPVEWVLKKFALL